MLHLYINIRLSVFEYIRLIFPFDTENIAYTDKELNAIIKHVIDSNYGIYDAESHTTPRITASNTEKIISRVEGGEQNFPRDGNWTPSFCLPPGGTMLPLRHHGDISMQNCTLVHCINSFGCI